MAQRKGENAQSVALESVTAISEECEHLRARVANFYATVDGRDFPLVEQEVGDVLHALHQSCKRLRKAKGTLAQEALPGMNEPAA